MTPKFGKKSIGLVTLEEVRRYVEQIEDSGRRGAARSACSALKGLMAFALQRGLIERNVLAGYPGPSIASRERVATQDELKLVWWGLVDMARIRMADPPHRPCNSLC